MLVYWYHRCFAWRDLQNSQRGRAGELRHQVGSLANVSGGRDGVDFAVVLEDGRIRDGIDVGHDSDDGKLSAGPLEAVDDLRSVVVVHILDELEESIEALLTVVEVEEGESGPELVALVDSYDLRQHGVATRRTRQVKYLRWSILVTKPRLPEPPLSPL